ncbi:saccharopine dehydrogenase [Longibacter salinarum]|uniref:Saccharopine dehydrogenase n=1 Tax=Longibacter salinarum TaxID=1850348 RepID=A0A2A8CWT3_9BACT|nr:saccharopine dehydrogenase NADP-binding domain-containing protein [Longibacter salinarum]PEN12848.1 saccharopine dehydrogenase [Longibacter salinarum]
MSLLIYGAYGYTGQLVTEQAVERGLTPIVAGRNAQKVHRISTQYDLPARVFSLDMPREIRRGLEDVDVVLHCAGPFMHTSAPMLQACLDTGTHYLDITGEIEVFEAAAKRDAEAKEAGIMVCPGVGFDVVPTDCTAKYLSEQLPDATTLEIAFMGLGRVSRGTALTAVSNLGEGGMVRRNGRIVTVPPAWTTREVDFGRGPKTVVSIPWGDVSTAYHSTGIPNVTAYTYLPNNAITLLRLSRYISWLLKWEPVKRVLEALVRMQPAGPDEDEREQGVTLVWGRATNDAGDEVTARLKGPEGYTFTAQTSVAAAQHVLDGGATPGFQTPSTAFGSHFVRHFEGVEVLDESGKVEG